MARELNGKVALVTGASRGLGAGIALSLGRAGAKIAVNYRRNAEMAEAAVDRIRSEGGDAEAFPADVTDEDGAADLVRRVVDRLGPVDILVLNATGPQPTYSIEELTWERMLDQLRFFAKSPMLLTQQVLGSMKERRSGRIIHIGSEVFELGKGNFSNYVAAKGAQFGLMRSWANELAPWQITVNLVVPGWIPVERHADAPQENKDAYAASVPMRRMGVPADIGEAVAFLASDAANFITGQKLSVNGGNTLE